MARPKRIFLSLNRKKREHKYAIVDAADYLALKKYKWHVKRDQRSQPTLPLHYAARRRFCSKTKRWLEITMHRQLMGLRRGQWAISVDHINGNGLDNRRRNMRRCTLGENSRNLHVIWGKVGIRGVTKSRNKWRANLRFNGRVVQIGFFQTERDAAVAYAFASRILHGEFGSLPGHDLRWHSHTHKP